MRRMIICFVAVLSAMWSAFGVTVTNVRGEQRQGSKLVDVYYDLNSTDGGTYTVEVVLEGDTETVQAISLTGDIGKGVKPGQSRHVVWDAGVDWVSKKGYVKAVVTATSESSSGKRKKVQLWEGGPSWATTNIGAENPEDYGYYFWWGDTVGYKRENNKWVASDGSNSNVSFNSNNTPTYNKSISTLRREGWIVSKDGTDVLAPEHDAAQAHWGGDWRIPTNQEFDDLYNKCDWTWSTMNGVEGYIVRGRGSYASKSIFLPHAGFGYGASLYDAGSFGHYWSSVPFYWPSVPNTDYYRAWGLFAAQTSNLDRSHVNPVRPVQGFTK